MVEFLFVIIELFRYLLRLRRYKQKSFDVGVFQRGWVTLSANFRRNGRRPPTTVGAKKTRVIGIIISAVYSLVLSQSTRDRQTDGRTDLQLS